MISFDEIFEKSSKNINVVSKSFETVDSLYFASLSNNATASIITNILDQNDLLKYLTIDKIKKITYIGVLEMLEIGFMPLPYEDEMYDSRYNLLENIAIIKLIAVLGFNTTEKILKVRGINSFDDLLKKENTDLKNYINNEYNKMEEAWQN